MKSPQIPEIQLKKIKNFITDTFPIEIETRGRTSFNSQMKKYLKNLQIQEFLI